MTGIRQSENAFSRLLSQHVTDYANKYGVGKKAIAKKLVYSESMFSHLMAGRRHVTHRSTIITIARGLELTSAQTSELLLSADFAPLSDTEEPALAFLGQVLREAEAATESLYPPERAIVVKFMSEDFQRLKSAWESYIFRRKELDRRKADTVLAWFDKKERPHEKIYNELRQSVSRILAFQWRIKAAASELLDRREDAEREYEEALIAAAAAQDPVTECRAHVGLGDIYKLMGRFKQAQNHYEKAIEATKLVQDSVPDDPIWPEHWRGRIKRKLGTLHLYIGRPDLALQELTTSISIFKALQGNHDYERVQGLYSLGWAFALHGDCDAALDHHLEGLSLAKDLMQREGKEQDDLLLMRGYLYVGDDYLDRRQLDKAECHFTRALELKEHLYARTQNDSLRQDTLTTQHNLYTNDEEANHEVGRIYLGLGRTYMYRRDPSLMPEARRHLERALRFYEKRRDPMRLAAVHNSLGGFYQTQRLLQRTGRLPVSELYSDNDPLTHFEEALKWARKPDTPSKYYEAAALVMLCTATLESEQAFLDPQLFDRRFAEAEAACMTTEHKYWQHAARLSVAKTRERLQKNDAEQAIHHARNALARACNHNRYIAEEVFREVLDIVAQLEKQDRTLAYEAFKEQLEEQETIAEKPGLRGKIRELIASVDYHLGQLE